MKSKKANIGILFCVLLSILLALSGCTNSSKTVSTKTPDKKNASSETSKKEAALTIVNATANQDSQMITVDVKMKNNSSSAQSLKPELFALVSNSTILSPDNKSDIPQQVPAQTNAEFKIQFDFKDLNGSIPLRLAYQPTNSTEPEQFFKLGNITISKPVANTPPPKQDVKTATVNSTPPKQQEQPKQETKTTTVVSSTPPKQQEQPKATDPNKIDLQLQTLSRIKVLAPVGWIKSPHDGGDFAGFQFINPKDGNEQMLVVASACSGCGYLNADTTQTPDPIGLIPEQTISTTLFKDGLSAGYSYVLNGNPYPGNGVVKMIKNEGYGFVEIVLPDSQKSIATQILNSFQFLGVY